MLLSLSDVTLGNNITFGFPLRTDPRAFIFTEIDVPEGTITNIEFYSTGIDIPLTFEIWRQINLTEYQLVTQIQHVTSAVGIQKVLDKSCACVFVCLLSKM